jgi:hypothetical protein
VITGLGALRVLVPGEQRPRRAVYVEEWSDPDADLAVLKVDEPPPRCAQIGRSRTGVDALGFGFRPTERATEPDGHAFDGRLSPVRLL